MSQNAGYEQLNKRVSESQTSERERVSKLQTKELLDMDNLVKSLKESFLILKELPSMCNHFERKLKQEMERLNDDRVDKYDTKIQYFSYFAKNVIDLASLTKQGEYQKIINKLNVNLTQKIISCCLSIGVPALGITMAALGITMAAAGKAAAGIYLGLAPIFIVCGFLFCLEVIRELCYQKSVRNENNRALIDVRAKLDKSPVDNTVFFSKHYGDLEMVSVKRARISNQF